MDLATTAELGTAGGTLILAVATYLSVRSANRSSRVAEQSMLQNLRPLLFPSRLSDDAIKVGFADHRLLRVPGGQGVIEVTDEACYLAISLRNVGRGMAVLDGFVVYAGNNDVRTLPTEPPAREDFRRLTRDLYVPPGEVFFWQGALRDLTDPLFAEVRVAAEQEQSITVDLLYTDEEGVQHMVTRFTLQPIHHEGEGRRLLRSDDGETVWLTSVSRHWNLDGPRPR